MNGYQAFDLMRKGGKVTIKDVGGVFYIKDGYIKFTTSDGKEHFSNFNFGGNDYEEIEETYTGLQAIEIMKDGQHVIEHPSSNFKYYISNGELWFVDSNGDKNISRAFNINGVYKIYK